MKKSNLTVCFDGPHAINKNDPYEIYMFSQVAKYFKLDFRFEVDPLIGIASGHDTSIQDMLKVWDVVVDNLDGLPNCKESSHYKDNLEIEAQKIADSALNYYEYYYGHDRKKYELNLVNEGKKDE